MTVFRKTAVFRKTFHCCQRRVSVQMRVAVGQAEDWYVGVAKYYKATTDCDMEVLRPRLVTAFS